MPSDDVILNLRQIAGFPQEIVASPIDMIVVQRGGLGGPYISISPASLVSTALATGGNMAIGGLLSAGALQSVGLQATTATLNWAGVQTADITALNTQFASIQGAPIATIDYVDGLIGKLTDNTVWSFNGRQGPVTLNVFDVASLGFARTYSPTLTGTPLAPTPRNPWQADFQIATTAFVQAAITVNFTKFLSCTPLVNSFNGRTGAVTLTSADLTGLGLLTTDSPAFTGVPTAPTPPPGTSTTQVATTAFVANAIEAALVVDLGYAPLNSPNFTGYATAPTPAPGSSSGQLATTAFVQAALAASVAGVASFNTRTGAVVLTIADITAAGGAPIASPALTGAPTAPTATAGTSTTQLATTAFVQAALTALGSGVASFNTRTGAVTLQGGDITAAGGALLAGPAFTGAPTAPTATVGTNTTQLATTAFVQAALASAAAGVASFNNRTGAVSLIANDISAAGGALLTSPGLTGTPTAPTASPGTNTTQIATTAFVESAIGGMVISFNGRNGAVTLTAADITGAGGAVLSSPVFTGSPTAPTAAPGTNTAQLATTAFVEAALSAATAGVASFNGRTGTVTLQAADVTSAGGALLASPIFTGTPSGPTATAGTSTAQLATTAFVQAALAATGVSSFNGRSGSVTLIANDVSAVGGALLAGPTFTGVPAAPTATAGTNTTQIATTAFVTAAISARTSPLAVANGGTGAASISMPSGMGFWATETPLLYAASATQVGVSASTATFMAWSGSTGGLDFGYASSAAGNYNYLNINRCRGTFASPALLQNGDGMFSINVWGWRNAGTNSGWGSGNHGGMGLQAAANWTAASQPTVLTLAATAVNATGATQQAFVLDPTNGVSLTGLGVRCSSGAPIADGVYIGFDWSASQYALIMNTTAWQGWGGFTAPVLIDGTSSALAPLRSLSIGMSTTSPGTVQMYMSNDTVYLWPASLTSDRRLKSNIKQATIDAVALFKKLKVYSCDFPVTVGADVTHADASIMADEVKDLIPQAYVPRTKVKRHRDDRETETHESLLDLPLIAMLIKAVQQLAARVEKLEAT